MLSIIAHAIDTAFFDVLKAIFTLAPGPIAYWIHRHVLDIRSQRLHGSRLHPRVRIALDIAIAVGIAFVAVGFVGQTCPQDDDGYCFDDNWKRPTTAENAVTFVRFAGLALIGMAVAGARQPEAPKTPLAKK